MSTSEIYPGQNYANHDTIINSVTSNNWYDLDTCWARRFLEEARRVLNQITFANLKKKVKSERLRYAKNLQTFWQKVIEEHRRNPAKRKRTVIEDDEKENLELLSIKRLKSIITLICLVQGNASTNAFAVDIDSSKLIGHLKKIIKIEKAPEFDNFPADKLKLWKVEIRDDHDDELSNLSLQNQDELLATKKISKYFPAILEEHIHIIVLPPESNMNSLKNGINSLFNDYNINKLCLYLEQKLKELIKRGNLYDDRELVTKVLFHTLFLDNIPNHLVDTEVPINIYHNKIKENNILYADLLIVEVKSANNAKQNRFIFEFKNKGVNFLDLQIKGKNSNWKVMEQRANKVNAMSRSDVLQLKCGNAEQFDNGKTIREIFNGACKQLLNYVHNLEKDDYQNHHEFITLAFVVISVGSRKLVWKKIN